VVFEYARNVDFQISSELYSSHVAGLPNPRDFGRIAEIAVDPPSARKWSTPLSQISIVRLDFASVSSDATLNAPSVLVTVLLTEFRVVLGKLREGRDEDIYPLVDVLSSPTEEHPVAIAKDHRRRRRWRRCNGGRQSGFLLRPISDPPGYVFVCPLRHLLPHPLLEHPHELIRRCFYQVTPRKLTRSLEPRVLEIERGRFNVLSAGDHTAFEISEENPASIIGRVRRKGDLG